MQASTTLCYRGSKIAIGFRDLFMLSADLTDKPTSDSAKTTGQSRTDSFADLTAIGGDQTSWLDRFGVAATQAGRIDIWPILFGASRTERADREPVGFEHRLCNTCFDLRRKARQKRDCCCNKGRDRRGGKCLDHGWSPVMPRRHRPLGEKTPDTPKKFTKF